MRKIILSLACISALCFGEDDPKCREHFESLPASVMEGLKMPWDGTHSETGELCFCTETMFCEKIEYCIDFKCPSDSSGAVKSSGHQQ
jgi:hypothetical protein